MTPANLATACFDDLIQLLDSEDYIGHSVENDTIQIQVRYADAAERLWTKFFRSHPYQLIHLEIFIGTKRDAPRYSSKLIPRSMQLRERVPSMSLTSLPNRSLFAKEKSNLLLLDAIPDPLIIYEADPEYGYRAKFLKYPLHPKQFNKPPEDILADGGKPVGFWDECIATPRRQAIEKAIATGEKVVNEYENLWNGFVWRLRHEVYPLEEYGEVLVIVTNQEGCEWQRDPVLWRSLRV